MSWSPELPIAEHRPWPDTVHVVRGKTEETRRYVPERTCRFKVVRPFISHDKRDRADLCECDECGYRCAHGFIEDERFKHCPNCGAKVVDE